MFASIISCYKNVQDKSDKDKKAKDVVRNDDKVILVTNVLDTT